MLKMAINIVDNLQVALRATCPRVDGLVLRTCHEKKKLKITSTDYHKVFHKMLSLGNKRKKKMVSQTNININDDKKVRIIGVRRIFPVYNR